jgi:hypothetical protein
MNDGLRLWLVGTLEIFRLRYFVRHDLIGTKYRYAGGQDDKRGKRVCA